MSEREELLKILREELKKEKSNGGRGYKISLAGLAAAFAIMSMWVAPMRDDVNNVEERIMRCEENIRTDLQEIDLRLRRERELVTDAIKARVRANTARVIELEKAERQNQRFHGRVEKCLEMRE